MSDYTSVAGLLGKTARRHRDFTWGDVKLQLQSITAGEYAQVERRLIDAASGSKGSTEEKRARALAEAHAMLIRLAVAQPSLSKDDAAKLLDVDAALTQSLVSACMEHCGLSGNDLEDLAKNSVETAGDDSLTG